MPELVGVRRNLWMTRDPKGFKRVNFPIDGLVLYLPLWHPELNGATIISKDLNAHSCTVAEAIWGATGRTFDGSNDSISASTLFTLTNAMTFMAWIYPHTYPTAGDENMIVILHEGTSASVRIGVLEGATDQFWLWGTNTIGAGYGAASGVAVPLNAWTHCAATVDTTTALTYQNGALVGSPGTAFTGTMKAHPSVRIGRSESNVYPWDGVIGEVLIYNRVLSAAEIAHSYNTTRWRYA